MILVCKKCGGDMRMGKALEQVPDGVPDFIGGEVCTVSLSGKAKLIICLKCVECGWSVIDDNL